MTLLERLSNYLAILVDTHITLAMLGLVVFVAVIFGVLIYFGHLVVGLCVLIGRGIKRLKRRQE